MKLQKIIDQLNTFAPLNLAGSWDKVGLQLGNPDQAIKNIFLCIDLTPAVLEEAIVEKTNLIIAYHPPIFAPLTALRSDNPKQNIFIKAIKHNIAIYSPHTALDAASGGVNDFLASAFDFATSTPLEILTPKQDITHKLIVYVPESHTDSLRQALSIAGAAQIGNYTCCSFASQGTGTFKPNVNANPYLGKPNNLEKVTENKLEIPCTASTNFPKLIQTLLAAHPYEEPAYEIIPLAPIPSTISQAQGPGRLVTLNKPIAIKTIIEQIKLQLKLKHLKLALPENQTQSTKIKTIAICPGAGASLFENIQADLYYTGEMSHHQVLHHTNQNAAVILTGHTNNERPYLKSYKKIIQTLTNKKCKITLSKKDKTPANII